MFMLLVLAFGQARDAALVMVNLPLALIGGVVGVFLAGGVLSVASIIGFIELTRAAQVVNNATFRPFTVYALVALIYFALCWPLSRLADRLERRLGRHGGVSVQGQV